jgi:hypothetical protein
MDGSVTKTNSPTRSLGTGFPSIVTYLPSKL